MSCVIVCRTAIVFIMDRGKSQIPHLKYPVIPWYENERVAEAGASGHARFGWSDLMVELYIVAFLGKEIDETG